MKIEEFWFISPVDNIVQNSWLKYLVQLAQAG